MFAKEVSGGGSISVNDAYSGIGDTLKKAQSNVSKAEKAAFDGDLTVQDSLKLQKAMMQLQESTALASNLMKSIHEMTMSVIQNMK